LLPKKENQHLKLIPVKDAGLGVGRRTIGRRIKNPPQNFPPVIELNKRPYFEETTLESYKAFLLQQAHLQTGGQA
jgi:hypothetical protein